ncbi:MAG: cadmium-translocating P-type ATPase [Anaerolineae bacterium]|nr:cadmium-translocating P-type ATPase [Anaerolineae bacterium]
MLQQSVLGNKPIGAAAKPDTTTSPSLFSQERLEPILVIVTLAAVIASAVAERFDLPTGIILGFNIVSYVAGGWFGVQQGMASLRKREINVDLLMVLAAIGAAIVDQWREGAILLFLFSLSNVLQAYAMDRSRNAIRALLKLRPNEATVRRDGELNVVPIENLQIDDVVVIRPGERFPIDGKVIAGNTTVDQSPITGESMPVLKAVGDDVFAGTVNQNGGVDVRVTRSVNDTTLSRIIQMVETAQGQRANTQRFLDEFEQRYAAFVVFAVILYIIIPPLLPNGPSFSDNFYRAMVLMTVASPCALIISTPASILSAIANAARHGILFKGGAYLEQMATIKAVAFDKTGTITTGKPAVVDVVPYENSSADELLATAATVEMHSEHPLASAIVAKAQESGLTIGEPDTFQAVPGMGVSGSVGGQMVLVGTERLMTSNGLAVPLPLLAERDRLEEEGKTTLLVYAGAWLGLIALADQLREGAANVLKSLRAAGVQHIVILTGDNERVARSIAKQIGADEVCASLLPEHKADAIKAIEAKHGVTAMVGDGVNDAPALASASIGIAMGAAGTDVALETADVVLMSDDLSNIAYAMHLSRRARRIVYQNLTFALAVIVVLVISALGFSLPLPFGVVGHEGSTVIVVTNGLRLLSFSRKVLFG